ncbi:unnamed protein product [Lampetra fluviatilis]
MLLLLSASSYFTAGMPQERAACSGPRPAAFASPLLLFTHRALIIISNLVNPLLDEALSPQAAVTSNDSEA